MIYDAAIIGGGPAGVTAAVYAKRAGLNLVLFEGKFIGGQIINSGSLENYTGFAEIAGADFAGKMAEQLKFQEISPVMEEVSEVRLTDDIKLIKTSKGEYEAKAVIIASGGSPKRLGLLNEEELTGRGVSYCAACDGAFFRNRTAAVVGGGNTALDDALYLSKLCKTVYLIHRREEFRGNKNTAEKLRRLENVKFILNSEVSELISDEIGLTGIKISCKNTNEITELPTDGLFVAVGTVPNTGIFRESLQLSESGCIICDSRQRTNLKGVYAAGDVCEKNLKQAVTAAADGAAAVSTLLEELY